MLNLDRKTSVLLGILILSNFAWAYLFLQNPGTKEQPLSETQGLASRLAPPSKDGRILPSAYEANEVRNTLVRAAHSNVQGCYNQWLSSNSKFERGELKVEWFISPDGKVNDPAVVFSELQGIENCVLGIISELQFPPPPSDRPVYIAHNFKFRKSEDNENAGKD